MADTKSSVATASAGTWKAMTQTRTWIETAAYPDRIARAGTLWRFAAQAMLPKDYAADQRWADCVVPSPEGALALELLDGNDNAEPSAADAHLSLFRVFYHRDLLIDCDRSDLDTIENIINDEMSRNRLIYPYRFGRLLYDRFNDTHATDRTKHLLADESLALLNGTPQGVFQAGKLVSGPLGLLEAQQSRTIPPSLRVRLWHCSDPGCGSPHDVELLPPDVPVSVLTQQIKVALTSKFGPASEWNGSLHDVAAEELVQRAYTYFDISVAIAECVVGDERSALLHAALEGRSGVFLRTIIGSPPRKKSRASGSPQAVSQNLTQEEQLQLLWLLSDFELVELIDSCIIGRQIVIPPTEVRSAGIAPWRRHKTAKCQLSSLGIRSAGSDPIIAATALIWEAYNGLGLTTELDWRLRNRSAGATRNSLLDFLSQHEPAESIRDLVLSSEPVTKKICDTVRCSVNGLDDQTLVDRLLWKVGFDLPRYSETYSLLNDRLDTFYQAVLKLGTNLNERDRETIRGAGVNLFVSIEEFLDELVAFNVWLLASDHLLETKFLYRLDEARRTVTNAIGSPIGEPPLEARWHDGGENSLGTLLAYLNAASVWMEDLTNADRSELLRQEADLPFYADDSTYVFPFRHRALWADAEYGALSHHIRTFKRIAEKTAQSNLAAIRNGLDHHRDEARFPTVESMVTFVARFREALEIADLHRFIPKPFWAVTLRTDRYGRTEVLVKDYRGVCLAVYRPTYVSGMPNRSQNEPLVIAPGNLTGHANAELIFGIRQRSSYSAYWQGYPRRRTIPQSAKSVAAETPHPSPATDMAPMETTDATPPQ